MLISCAEVPLRNYSLTHPYQLMWRKTHLWLISSTGLMHTTLLNPNSWFPRDFAVPTLGFPQFIHQTCTGPHFAMTKPADSCRYPWVLRQPQPHACRPLELTALETAEGSPMQFCVVVTTAVWLRFDCCLDSMIWLSFALFNCRSIWLFFYFWFHLDLWPLDGSLTASQR